MFCQLPPIVIFVLSAGRSHGGLGLLLDDPGTWEPGQIRAIKRKSILFGTCAVRDYQDY